MKPKPLAASSADVFLREQVGLLLSCVENRLRLKCTRRLPRPACHTCSHPPRCLERPQNLPSVEEEQGHEKSDLRPPKKNTEEGEIAEHSNVGEVQAT